MKNVTDLLQKIASTIPKIGICFALLACVYLFLSLVFSPGVVQKHYANSTTLAASSSTGICPNLSQGATCCYSQKDFDGITRCYAGTGSNGFNTSPCYYTGGPVLCPGQTTITPLPTGCQNRTYNECEQGNTTACLNWSGCKNGNCLHHMVTVKEDTACQYTCTTDLGICPQYVTPSPSPTSTPTPTPTITPTPNPNATSTPTPTPTPTPTITPTPNGTSSNNSTISTLTAVSQTGARVFLADNVLGIQAVVITGQLTYDPVTQSFSNPNFNISKLPPGTYQFFLHVDGYLDKQLTNNNGNLFTITQGRTTFSIGPVALIAGDIAPLPSGDNTINILDYNAVLSCIGLTAASLPTSACSSPKLADVNKDGVIDKKDLDYIQAYFGRKGDAPSGSANNQYYTCVTDPNCQTKTKSLQMCPLKCTKQ